LKGQDLKKHKADLAWPNIAMVKFGDMTLAYRIGYMGESWLERLNTNMSGDCNGRYLDLINNRNMVIKTPNGRKTQIWYFDQRTLTIKTRLNNQSFDIKSSGRTRDM
jgi:hypothetical protein